MVGPADTAAEPPAPKPETPDDIRAGLAEVRAAVTHAREAEALGGMVDLAGLELLVGQLCDALMGLPRDQAIGFEPELATLIGEFDTLAKTLAERKAQLTPAPDPVSQRQRALQAYGKPPKR